MAELAISLQASNAQAEALRIQSASVTTAKAVAAQLGIVEAHGEFKPADKLALVQKLQHEGRIVAVAGDGINDAPAASTSRCKPMTVSRWALGRMWQ